jgi:hypothetical protein
MTRANSSSLPFRKSTARFMTNYLTPSTAPDPSSQGSTARHSSKSSSSVLWLSVDLRWRTQFRDLAEAVKRRLTPSVSNINPLNMPASRQRCSLNILLAHPIRRRYCRFLFGRCHCLPSRWSLGLATRRQGPPDLWSGHIPDQRLGILCQFQVRNSVVSHFWEVRLWSRIRCLVCCGGGDHPELSRGEESWKVSRGMGHEPKPRATRRRIHLSR